MWTCVCFLIELLFTVSHACSLTFANCTHMPQKEHRYQESQRYEGTYSTHELQSVGHIIVYSITVPCNIVCWLAVKRLRDKRLIPALTKRQFAETEKGHWPCYVMEF